MDKDRYLLPPDEDLDEPPEDLPEEELAALAEAREEAERDPLANSVDGDVN